MTSIASSLREEFLAHWWAFDGLVSSSSNDITAIDGHNLDLATVVAVARHVFMIPLTARCSVFDLGIIIT